jgi:hypothetical protein
MNPNLNLYTTKYQSIYADLSLDYITLDSCSA